MTESKNISFTIDGQPVQAGPGETVLSVARRRGFHIPTLCHHESVSAYGACRLCVVEAFWGKRSKLVTSCIYTPYENDRVETNTERVRRTRGMVLELLSARCPGVKQIRDLACEYGVDNPRFDTDDAAKRERCILCGLCVRVCDEVVGQHAISYASRGMERVITTPFGAQAEECIGCGACVYVCPTDALHYEDIDGQRIMKELNTTLPLLPCRVCGRGFATEKQVARVKARLRLPEELAETCPRCRAGEFRTELGETLGRNGKRRTDADKGLQPLVVCAASRSLNDEELT